MAVLFFIEENDLSGNIEGQAYMEKEKHKVNESFCLWVSHSEKIVSFHPEDGLEKQQYPNHTEMWEMVHSLVKQGYLAQQENENVKRFEVGSPEGEAQHSRR